VLNRRWDVIKENPDIQVFDVYFGDAICDAIQKMEFATTGAATFLTSEEGLSSINFLP
jgi:hypothetical protein